MPSDRLHPRRIDVPDMSADMIAGAAFRPKLARL